MNADKKKSTENFLSAKTKENKPKPPKSETIYGGLWMVTRTGFEPKLKAPKYLILLAFLSIVGNFIGTLEKC